MQRVAVDDAGPTAERYRHAIEKTIDGDVFKFYTVVGHSRSSRRISMLDDSLGRAWMRQKISGEEYQALRRYALHWLAGGLQGPLQSVDCNRIFAFDPAAMSGIAKTERQQDHRDAYWAAHDTIGDRPALVADAVACADCSLQEAGFMLGYRSPWHAREAAREILSDAGYRLGQVWKDRDKGN